MIAVQRELSGTEPVRVSLKKLPQRKRIRDSDRDQGMGGH